MADDDVSAAWHHGYWAARQSPSRGRETRRYFALQIRSRRDRLALILADDSQEWPPPAELTPWAKLPRDPPSRDDARKILELRSGNGKRGIHQIAKQLWISWRSVKWVVDVFE
jgi:hypothetical protein